MPQTPFNREVRQIALAGLATTASVLAEQDPDLADALTELVASFTDSTQSVTAPAPTQARRLPDTPVQGRPVTPAPAVVVDLAQAVEQEPVSAEDLDDDIDDDEQVEDPLAQLAGEVDDAVLDAVLPQELVVTVTNTSGMPLTITEARPALQFLMPTLLDNLGHLDEAAAEEDAEDEATVRFRFTGDRQRLAAAGAGRTVVEPREVPLPALGANALVSATVGGVADEEAAAELGTLPPDLPEVGEGEHPINGVLAAIEEHYGVRPQANGVFRVTFTRADGQELTEDQVAEVIVADENAMADMRRLGDTRLLTVTDAVEVDETTGQERPVGAHAKTAHFAVFDRAENGWVDLATVAIGAARFSGNWHFPDLGWVHATMSAQLVEAPEA